MQKVENRDCIKAMQELESESIDIILTDPPYKYLKNQKLESDFDEEIFFKEAGRVLKKGGFLVFFGRGTSFYRWNYIAGELKEEAKTIFEFKEEFVWDKGYCSSPLLAVSRVHETVAIYAKGKGKINRVKVPYVKMREHDLDRVINDVNRLKTSFNNSKTFDAILRYLESNQKMIVDNLQCKTGALISSSIKRENRNVAVAQQLKEGMNEKSIIREYESTLPKTSTSVSSKIGLRNRCVAVMQAMHEGMNEKSIIREDLYKSGSPYKHKHCVATSKTMKNPDRAAAVMRGISEGMNEKSIIREDLYEYGDKNSTVGLKKINKPNRCVSVMQGVKEGMNEKSIIKEGRDHYNTIHPTQKPVELLKRLLNLVVKSENDVVLDPFAGSCSTGAACKELGLNFLGYEIDEEYYQLGSKRLEEHIAPPKELF